MVVGYARLANCPPYAFVRLRDAGGRAIADTSLPAFRDRLPEWRNALEPGAYQLEVVHGPGVLASAAFEVSERGIEGNAREIALTLR